MIKYTKYVITPRVVEADKVTRVSVTGLDNSCLFYDDTEYIVTVTASDNFTYPSPDRLGGGDRVKSEDIPVMPKDGVISFEYKFTGEHLWYVNIKRVENEKHFGGNRMRWPYIRNSALDSILEFEMYSLYSDLYERKPFKGDFHVHSFGSDGKDSPELVAAQYRQHGFDTLSITDHYVMEPSVEVVKKYEGIDTGIKLIVGEEVHHTLGKASYHVVNLNPCSSVNEIIINKTDEVESVVRDIARTLDIADECDRMEIAWHKWIYDEIKKAGGVCIFPHPYWEPGKAQNIKSSVTEAVYKLGLCDVIELMNGDKPQCSRAQMQLYYEMRADGYRYPIVSSTDNHNSLIDDDYFTKVWTIVYAKDAEDIVHSITEGYTACIDALEGECSNVYAEKVRIARYTWFLMRNYYKRHDLLSCPVGQAMTRFALGREDQKDLIELLQKEVVAYEKEFFGR